MEAFGEAVAIADEDALKEMLGAKFRELIPPVGTDDRYRFLEAWARSHVIEGNDGKMARVAAGGDGWTLPIPLVKAAAGWQFDTAAGAEEMRVRRIGRNELAAQQTLLAIYDACLSRPWQPRGRRMPGRTATTAITAITISYSPGRALTPRRRARLCRERQAAGWIRHRGVAGTVLGHGGDELHRESRRTGLGT